jgi:hypothetical protein
MSIGELWALPQRPKHPLQPKGQRMHGRDVFGRRRADRFGEIHGGDGFT